MGKTKHTVFLFFSRGEVVDVARAPGCGFQTLDHFFYVWTDRPCVYDSMTWVCVIILRRVHALRAFVAMRVEGGDDGRARDVDAREHEMAEIETTYQVIKYEVRTRADVGESAMGDDGCMAG